MFKSNENQSIDVTYFQILLNNDEQIIIKSICTGHTWRIVKDIFDAGYDIYHKHRDIDEFHWHASASIFCDAIDSIVGHDEFQLNGRRVPYKVYTRDGVYLHGRKLY